MIEPLHPLAVYLVGMGIGAVLAAALLYWWVMRGDDKETS